MSTGKSNVHTQKRMRKKKRANLCEEDGKIVTM